MKLTKEQADEIKNQQSQSNPTKRVTAPELEKILYEAIPALDHGFVRVIDYMGDDYIYCSISKSFLWKRN
jgi:thymidylate synthase (FAD)